MAYTNVSKPSSTSYTQVNPSGRTTFDQSDITYDDSGMFYDGVNPNAYTNISKPTSSVYTKVAKPT